MFLDDTLTFDVPTVRTGPDGHQTFEAYPARDGHPGEFVGDAYLVSTGRADQTPPIVSDLILQTTRAGGTVSYRADFDADNQYTGYTVILTLDGKPRELKITGAASRPAFRSTPSRRNVARTSGTPPDARAVDPRSCSRRVSDSCPARVCDNLQKKGLPPAWRCSHRSCLPGAAARHGQRVTAARLASSRGASVTGRPPCYGSGMSEPAIVQGNPTRR